MKKTIYKDFFINILASGIVTCVLQILVYPVLGQTFNIKDYGLLLTIMGLVNIIASAFGNSLNNTRLLKNNLYKNPGDFNILLLFSSMISFLLMLLLVTLVFKSNLYMSFLIAFLTLLSVIRQYLIVDYRLNLDFKGLLVNNIYISIGYCIGLVLSLFFKNWIYAFIMGELFGVLHCLKKNRLIFEPLKFTNKYKETYQAYLHLIISILFGQAMLYIDRFIIMPFLGSEMVSIYTVASYAGKTLGILAIPISSVLLSYYTKKDFVFTKKKLYQNFLIVMVISSLSFVIIQLLCPYVLPLFYPQIYTLTIPYLALANIGSILTVSSNLLQPAIMKVAKTKYQIYIQLVFIFTFLISVYIFIGNYGLYAICFAMILANVIRILFMLFIGSRSLSNLKENI